MSLWPLLVNAHYRTMTVHRHMQKSKVKSDQYLRRKHFFVDGDALISGLAVNTSDQNLPLGLQIDDLT